MDGLGDGVAPMFFATEGEWRAWLTEHHETATEVWVGFHRKATGRPSITWSQAVDEALCFGWIDGVRRRVDDASYTNRFTPRRARSNWSAVNVRRAEDLIERGLMTPAGLRAFQARAPEGAGPISYEQRAAARLDEAQESALRSNRKAWDFFRAQPEGYRRTAIWWVVSAKRPETRQRRLETLVADSARGERVPPLRRRPVR